MVYMPIRFKRWQRSKWEIGWFMMSDGRENILEEDRKTVIDQIYDYKSNWF